MKTSKSFLYISCTVLYYLLHLTCAAKTFSEEIFLQGPKESKLRSAKLLAEQKSITEIKRFEIVTAGPNHINERFKKQRSSGVRIKRSEQLMHKLVRVPPINTTQDSLAKENILHDVKLNTSSFAGPNQKDNLGLLNENKSSTYEQIEDLVFADFNATQINVHVNDTDDENLPSPEELVAIPHYRSSNKHRISIFKGDLKRKRIPIWSHQVSTFPKRCERFTASMCIKADDYPMEQIMGSIRRHKNAMPALLAEYHDKTAELEYQEQLEEYHFNSKRREDGNVITPGGMCASIVKYARPQKARSASGEWKYIVNTGRHTQTLRLEKCSTPQESCSYLSHNYRSRCTQVYNYHRLLSWDKMRGLHVDIFKVPTCCSCQIDGYRETFPPLGGSKHKEYKNYSPVPNNNPYSPLNDEIDYEDEDDEDVSIPYQFNKGIKKNKNEHYKHSELVLGSTNIKTKVNSPELITTIGSYLSPPDKFHTQISPKIINPTYHTHSNSMLNAKSRKPFKSYIPNESRSDLEISGTEKSNKGVKAVSISDNARIQQKRTRLYSGISNDDNSYQPTAYVIESEQVPSSFPAEEFSEGVISTSTKGPDLSKDVLSGKRINYNYHPIIDFFESHQKPTIEHIVPSRKTAINTISKSSETINTTVRKTGYTPENNWLPIMVNSK